MKRVPAATNGADRRCRHPWCCQFLI